MAHFAGYYSRSGEPAEFTEAGFLDRIPFLSSKQQCHSTEWVTCYTHGMTNADQIMHGDQTWDGTFSRVDHEPNPSGVLQGQNSFFPLRYARII